LDHQTFWILDLVFYGVKKTKLVNDGGYQP